MNPDSNYAIPAEVLDAIQHRDTIGAIKKLREATGLGLKEAKDIIDAHMRGAPVGMARSKPSGPLPPAVTHALEQGNKIEAIKLLREISGLDLKGAKDAVTGHEMRSGTTRTGLAPGEMPKSGHNSGWFVAVIILAVVAWVLFRNAT